MLKAGEVVELLMLPHGEPPSGRAAPVDCGGMLIKRFRTAQAVSRNVKRCAGRAELLSYRRRPSRTLCAAGQRLRGVLLCQPNLGPS